MLLIRYINNNNFSVLINNSYYYYNYRMVTNTLALYNTLLLSGNDKNNIFVLNN